MKDKTDCEILGGFDEIYKHFLAPIFPYVYRAFSMASKRDRRSNLILRDILLEVGKDVLHFLILALAISSPAVEDSARCRRWWIIGEHGSRMTRS